MIAALFTLAQSAATPGVSPEAVGIIIASVITALIGGGLLGKKVGETQRIRLAEPVPPITTYKGTSPPTWDQHSVLRDRVSCLEHTVAEQRRDMAIQFRELLQAGGERELRLAEKLDGIARGIHHRIDEIMRDATAPHTTRK
jgi:hypothetical protein